MMVTKPTSAGQWNTPDGLLKSNRVITAARFSASEPSSARWPTNSVEPGSPLPAREPYWQMSPSVGRGSTSVAPATVFTTSATPASDGAHPLATLTRSFGLCGVNHVPGVMPEHAMREKQHAAPSASARSRATGLTLPLGAHRLAGSRPAGADIGRSVVGSGHGDAAARGTPGSWRGMAVGAEATAVASRRSGVAHRRGRRPRHRRRVAPPSRCRSRAAGTTPDRSWGLQGLGRVRQGPCSELLPFRRSSMSTGLNGRVSWNSWVG